MEEDKIFYIDEDLKIREQIVFVNYQTNGSEYESNAQFVLKLPENFDTPK